MTDKTHTPDEPEEKNGAMLEAEPETAEEAPAPEPTDEKPSSGGRWFLLLLLLVAAIAAGLLLTPADVRQKWLAGLGFAPQHQTSPQSQSTVPAPQASVPETAADTPAQTPQASTASATKETDTPPAETPEPGTSSLKLTDNIEADSTPTPAQQPAGATEPAPIKVRPAIGEQETQQLLDAMNSLQGELKTLEEKQQQVRETQSRLQKIQLRTRLRWIANPVNHLPQIELAWEEIGRMPTLSQDERDKAQAMYTLAQQRNEDIRRWQQALNDAAARLRPQQHENIIPTPEHPWLKRLFGQFSLKRAPGKEERQLTLLRRQLQETARNLRLEQWPDPIAWQKLRARVQLALANRVEGDTQMQMPRLPDSFSDIARDIERLRQSAQDWQERL